MRIIGIDASLTSTGLAEYHDGAYKTHHHGRAGKNSDTLAQRRARLDDSKLETLDWVYDNGNEVADLVLIESHTFAAKGGSQHDRSGLWWLIVDALLANDTPIVEVSPSQIKLFATGKGNADKDAVMIATVRRFRDVEFSTNDEADALNLVDMALLHRGMLSGFDYQHKACDKVVWR